jgi:hypothetical protein
MAFRAVGKSEFFGNDTFVIEQGKISIQMIASFLYDLFPVLREKNKMNRQLNGMRSGASRSDIFYCFRITDKGDRLHSRMAPRALQYINFKNAE